MSRMILHTMLISEDQMKDIEPHLPEGTLYMASLVDLDGINQAQLAGHCEGHGMALHRALALENA